MAEKTTNNKEESVPLAPNQDSIKVSGKLFYNEGSWNTIRLKKEVLHEFPQLREKDGNFTYNMTILKTVEELKKMIAEMEKNGTLPILMTFNKENGVS